MLVVDSREKGSLPARVLRELPSMKAALSAGDYMIPTTYKESILIERSTGADFVGKIVSGRLWEQLRKCMEGASTVYFVIENPGSMRYSKLPMKAVISAMTAVTQKARLFVTSNATETYYLIEKLHREFGSEGKPDVDAFNSRIKPKSMSHEEQAQWALMGITKVGEKTAKKMLMKAGSLSALSQMEAEEMRKQFGKVGEAVYRVFHSDCSRPLNLKYSNQKQ